MMSDGVDSIDVGKHADLVVLAGLVLDHTRSLGGVRQVWRNGSVVVEQGQLAMPEQPYIGGAI
jgi:imidazolonepropionase-like amidohydrolase